MPSSGPKMKAAGPSRKSEKPSELPVPGSTNCTTDANMPLVVARLILKGHRDRSRKIIRQCEDPALFALQVGLTLGALLDNPVQGYHELRKLLTS